MAAQKPQADRRIGAKTIGGLADRLGYYLSRSGPGDAGSNFGAMCERLAVTGHASIRCPSCRGSGLRDLDIADVKERRARALRSEHIDAWKEHCDSIAKDSECRVCNGIGAVDAGKRPTRVQCVYCNGQGKRPGWVCVACQGKGCRWRAAPDSMFNTVRCNKCRGCGEVMDEDAEDICPTCIAEMSIIPVTVKETGCSKKGKAPKRVTGTDGDGNPTATRVHSTEWHDAQTDTTEEETAAYGEMSRLSLHIRETNPYAASALEAYYGPDGDRWAPTRWGRIFALWPLTKAGQALIRRARESSHEGHGFELSDLDTLASERNAEDCATVADMFRRSKISEADRAARALLQIANDALGEAGAK